ncbi:MAG: trigger factor [Oscillospiraceae bacterium]|jgi:trigger factor|nr:trigger factor [Oscillospiraceae bacterium]
MPFVTKEKTGPATYIINALIDPEEFREELDAVFEEELANITVPGFRKGKAPRKIVEQKYGEKLFYEEAIEGLLDDAVEDAVAESGLKLHLNPYDLEIDTIDKEAGVTFHFTAVTAPEVSVEGYRGLEVKKPIAEVLDSQVEERLLALQRRSARQVTIEDRPAQTGDIATISYEGFKDGVAFEGGTGENYDLTLGSGQFIPGFEGAILGHSVGESFDIDVTFPETYHAAELAGQPVVFHVSLNGLKAEELSALDDDFAKEVGENADTLEELKEEIRAELLGNNEKTAKKVFDENLQKALLEKVDAEISDKLFDQRTERNLELFQQQMQLPLERYLEYTGMEEGEFRAQFFENAMRQVTVELTLSKIAELENLTVSAEEIEAEYQKIADQYEVEVARAKLAVPTEEIETDLKRRAALKLVEENAVIIPDTAEDTDYPLQAAGESQEEVPEAE